MSTKNVILKKKIESEIYDLLPKTSAEQVTYGDSTVAVKLAAALADIATLTEGSGSGSISEQITAAVAGKANASDVVTAIVASATNGAITVTKGETSSDVKLKGISKIPTWDGTARKLTIPYIDASGTDKSLEVNIGKDMVVKEESHYDTETEELVLVLTDDSEVKIPVGALVDIYTGGTTNTVEVNVSDQNVVTANVRISAKSGNQLSAVSDSGSEGLFVPAPTVDAALNGTSVNAVQNKVINAALANKVDKDGSKVLSTNDFTNAYKTQVDTNKSDIATLKTNLDNKVSKDGSKVLTDVNFTTAYETKVKASARVLLNSTQPSDLTENDLWLQEV